MRTFVCASSSLLGLNIMRQLRKFGCDATAAVNSGESAKILSDEGFQPVMVDMAQIDTLRDGIDGHQQLVLLTPYCEQMGSYAQNIVSAAKACGIQFIVQVCSVSSGTETTYDLGRVHGYAIQAVKESEIASCTIYQPNYFQVFSQQMALPIRQSGVLPLAWDEARVALVDARDVAKAIAVILRHSAAHTATSYDLTGSEALSGADVADIISAASGRPVQYRGFSQQQTREYLLERGLDRWMLEMTLSHARHLSQNGAANVTDHIQMITGEEPRHFREFASEFADCWK